MKARILIIHNEENIRFTFAGFLEDAGYGVATANNYPEAMAQLEKNRFDLICVGLFLGDETGIDLLREIKSGYSCCQVIVIADFPSVETAVDALRLGAFDYLIEPVRQQRLLKAVAAALHPGSQFEGKDRC